MSTPISGQGGSGSVTVYEWAAGQVGMLEALSFQIDTDGTAGTHAVRVTLEIPTVGVVARLDDLNVAGPGQTNFYSYGLGLNASACTLPSGLAVTDALPWTALPPGAQVIVTAINAAGVEIAGDLISAVLLQLDEPLPAPPPPALLPLSLLPGSVAA